MGKERRETTLGRTGVQKRKQGAGCGTYMVQYNSEQVYPRLLQDYSRSGLTNGTLA
jgi:hypothetical protein